MPIFRGSTSRGAHVRALADALLTLIEDLPDVPSERRVRLRTHLAALKRAYVADFPTDTDLEHELHEEMPDGI